MYLLISKDIEQFFTLMSAQISYHMLNFSSPYLSTVVIKDMIPRG